MAKVTPKSKAWDAFSAFIRLRDSFKTMGNNFQCRCISCGAIKTTTGTGCIQAGHFISGRHGAVLFNEDLVHGQCYHCNIGLKGNWVKYEAAMIEMYGREKVEEFKKLDKMGSVTIKYTRQDYANIEQKYKQLVKDMGGIGRV
jgi:hypothetical protein